jgi:hypothetical protein
VHQIREQFEILEGISQMSTLIAYIDIDRHDTKKYRVYLACNLSFVQKISKIFLHEDIYDEETLIDMVLETTNLIVGSAKVIAETSQDAYTINTPHFEKIGVFDLQYDQSKIIRINENEFTIAIRELNG